MVTSDWAGALMQAVVNFTTAERAINARLETDKVLFLRDLPQASRIAIRAHSTQCRVNPEPPANPGAVALLFSPGSAIHWCAALRF